MNTGDIVLFLCGDVMTGRGIDQILPHPGDPMLHEPYVKDARRYVALAEAVNGPIPSPVDFTYVWGDALEILHQAAPDVKLINLETSVTVSADAWPGKGIHYRMHPANIACVTAAGIDCCVLANNHVLDWGYAGLEETLATLHGARVKCPGAGRDRREAEAPAVIEVPGKGRVVVVSLGDKSSGIPADWAPSEDRPGVNLLQDLSQASVHRVRDAVQAIKQAGDITVASIHWGANWGYGVPPKHQWFARRLIDAAGIDLVHGHSSHHVMALEVYRGKGILYGCGDFLNDYEGIGGYEAYRPDLALMYFASICPTEGALRHMRMVPVQMRRFRINRASREDSLWLQATLRREGSSYGTDVALNDDGSLELVW